jgi:hypothetical protein
LKKQLNATLLGRKKKKKQHIFTLQATYPAQHNAFRIKLWFTGESNAKIIIIIIIKKNTYDREFFSAI